jgi:hypothetical protein
MELPTAQKKSKQIFLAHLKAHQYKLRNKQGCSATFTAPKSEEHNNDNDMNSSDYKNSYVPLCVFVPDKKLDCLTNSHDKVNTLDILTLCKNCLSNSHHKIAFDNDEDFKLVEESTLATLEVSLSKTTVPSRTHP